MIKGLTSILLPSAFRPRELARCLAALYAADYHTPIEVLVSIVDGDVDSYLVMDNYPVNTITTRSFMDYERGQVWVWNELARTARGEWLALFADDLVPDHHWLINALDAAQTLGKPGLIGFNDLHSNGDQYAAHFIAHRQFLLDHCGGCLFPPHYHAWWCDREISDIAQAQGVHVWARRAIVEHLHWNWQRAQIDRTYADALPWHQTDRDVYQSRKAAGFPKDYEPVIA